MRGESSRSAGRGRHGLMAALALASVLAFCFWPKAEATPSRAQKIEQLVNSPMSENRRRALIDELSLIDSADARTRLKNLADSKDDKTAALALATLCRRGISGGEDKMKSVFEDTRRSDLARGMALAAYCELKKKSGSSWAQIKSYVKQKAGNDQLLKDQLKASKAHLWASEVDDDQ
jgi:hypothetical protein